MSTASQSVRLRRFPFSANPVGWYAVAYSDELAPRGIVSLDYFGRALVLFRGDDGRAAVLDAHCPHLGAHLGLGTVDGDGVRCPFHAWRFDCSGSCTDVPYAKKLPRASVRAWPVLEQSGLILVYFHPQAEAPAWELPSVPEHADAAWTPYVKRRWRIRTNIHEMVENAFDAAHFRYLHKLHDLPQPQLRFDGPRFFLDAATRMDTPFGVIDGRLAIESHGFGLGLVHFTGLIETLLLTTITPIDDEYVDARFTFTVKKLPDEGATRTVGLGFIDELSRQVAEDIRVWESKVYVERPVLVAEDAAISHFRRWARQFYVDGGKEPAQRSAV
jgi:phenylpropionate dioxygenase-like ring-hydroxylating dioxygenase large terminal subunit